MEDDFFYKLFHELLIPGCILFSIPFGVQRGVYAIFGTGKVTATIGIVLGVALAFIAYLNYNHYTQLDKAYEDECDTRKHAEDDLMYTQNQLAKALNLMTEAQKEEYYRSN